MTPEDNHILNDGITKLFYRYAIPAVIGMLAISSAGVIDGIFLGNYVGSHALAAINLTTPLNTLFFGLTLMLSVGGMVSAGKFIGQGNMNAANAIFSKTMTAIALISITGTLLALLFLPQIVALLGANEELFNFTETYIRIFLYFQPLFMIGFSLSYFVRVAGKPGLSGMALLISAIANVALDWLFIVRWEMGIAGAAWATGIAYALMFFTLLPSFFGDKALLHYQLKQQQWRQLKTSAINGLSEFSNELSIGLTALLFNWVMITRMGTDGVAAVAVINYILFVGLMVAYAIGDSLQPIISTNMGAGMSRRIKKLLIITTAHLLLLAIAIITLLLLFPHVIIDLFLQDSDSRSIAITTAFIALFWPAFIFNGLNIACTAYFTAMHRPMQSASIALTRSLICPVLLLTLLPQILGDNGIFLVIPIAEGLTFILAAALYWRYPTAAMVNKNLQTVEHSIDDDSLRI